MGKKEQKSSQLEPHDTLKEHLGAQRVRLHTAVCSQKMPHTRVFGSAHPRGLLALSTSMVPNSYAALS